MSCSSSNRATDVEQSPTGQLALRFCMAIHDDVLACAPVKATQRFGAEKSVLCKRAVLFRAALIGYSRIKITLNGAKMCHVEVWLAGMKVWRRAHLSIRTNAGLWRTVVKLNGNWDGLI